MQGNSSSDISAASKASKDRTGISTTGRSSSRDRSETWHHETDGTTMRYVDKDVHTRIKKQMDQPILEHRMPAVIQ